MNVYTKGIVMFSFLSSLWIEYEKKKWKAEEERSSFGFIFRNNIPIHWLIIMKNDLCSGSNSYTH